VNIAAAGVGLIMNTPGGEGTFDIHFYMNEVTGDVYYFDYKVKFGGGQRN